MTRDMTDFPDSAANNSCYDFILISKLMCKMKPMYSMFN